MSDRRLKGPGFGSGAAAVPVQRWLERARELFGDKTADWRFICPACGNVQSPRDFKDAGLDPQLAYQECIGRHQTGGTARGLASEPGPNGTTRPCDYAAYGLFTSGYKVTGEGGNTVNVFPFAGNEGAAVWL